MTDENDTTSLKTALTHLGRDLAQHLVVLREPPGLVLGVNQVAVDPNVENASPALDQLTNQIEFLLDRIRQTGGLREVVSLHAVFNRDLHRSLLGTHACTCV